MTDLAMAVADLEPLLVPGDGADHTQLVLESMARTVDFHSRTKFAKGAPGLLASLDPQSAAQHAAAATRLALELLPAAMQGTPALCQDDLWDVTWAVANMAPLLEPREAEAAIRVILEALSNNANASKVSVAADLLPPALGALAKRLGSAEAAATIRFALHITAKKHNSAARNTVEAAVATLAIRVGIQDAPATAELILEAASRSNDSHALAYLVKALTTLVPRLPPPQAHRQASAATTLGLEAMTKTTNFYTLDSLARSLTALAAWTTAG